NQIGTRSPVFVSAAFSGWLDQGPDVLPGFIEVESRFGTPRVESHRLIQTGLLLGRGYPQHTIQIEVAVDQDRVALSNSAEPFDTELADQGIVRRHGVLALVDGDVDLRLVVVKGRKNLRLADRQWCIAVDDRRVNELLAFIGHGDRFDSE